MDFRLRDYLSPGGTKPYNALADDLEASLRAGNEVYLWSVPGFFMLAGHPGMVRPWSDGNKWYKSAKDCLNGKRGKV